MSVSKISSAILGVGVDDTTLDLFESQYPVPAGVSYNSYVILDEKVAVLDTVDARATDAWLENLSQALAGRMPDYLVVSHMEPDHGANIARLAAAYPAMQVVGNAKTFVMMDQFFGAQAVAADRRVVVKEGDTLSLGSHTLQFVLAPMVHWPEVMLSYETSEKVLFSADAFGRFGAVANYDANAEWARGPPLLPEHRGQVRRAGAGRAEKGRCAGDQHHLPAAWPGADRRPDPLLALLRSVVQLPCRGAGKDPGGLRFDPRQYPCGSPYPGRKAACTGCKGGRDGPDPYRCVVCRYRGFPLRKDRAGLRNL